MHQSEYRTSIILVLHLLHVTTVDCICWRSYRCVVWIRKWHLHRVSIVEYMIRSATCDDYSFCTASIVFAQRHRSIIITAADTHCHRCHSHTGAKSVTSPSAIKKRAIPAIPATPTRRRCVPLSPVTRDSVEPYFLFDRRPKSTKLFARKVFRNVHI